MKSSNCKNNLDLTIFKKSICKEKTSHDLNICIYYHNNKDYIRDFSEFNYLPILCKNQLENKCNLKEDCKLSHNPFEYFYHPENYKKNICKNNKDCKLGIICPHAHKDLELNIKLIHNLKLDKDFYINHFKTVLCPFKYFHGHNKRDCVYYHNFIDIRRDLNCHNYNTKQCRLWNNKNIKFYNQGCKNGINCIFSHGIFENFYHPNNYKKNNCKHLDKCKNKHCPFKH